VPEEVGAHRSRVVVLGGAATGSDVDAVAAVHVGVEALQPHQVIRLPGPFFAVPGLG
jgi:hypothetical protein